MTRIKNHIMKTPIKFMFLFISTLLLTFTSCQDEVIEETPPNEQEIIQPDSNLANLMRSTSANDGSVDDIMDNSDCFTVNLPVTIIANGITITIETLDDLSLLEAIFDASNTDDDDLEFLFPITIILNDYTEVNIDSIEALNDFIDACITNENIIACVDFVYPISFSIYNTDFQVIDTVVIDNDYELYIFLEGLEGGNQGVVLASLNFPVTMQYVNGNTIEVFNNQELEEAINAASENCDDVCAEEDVIAYLQECYWNIVSYNGDDTYIDYDVYFSSNGSIAFIEDFVTVAIGGNWTTSTTNVGVVVSISELTAYAEDLEGDWLVENCNDTRFVLTQQINSETVEMVLEQDCEGNPFDCFSNTSITACDFDNDGFATFDLETQVLDNITCNVDFTASFHISETNAIANINPIAQPNSYTNISNPQTIYMRIAANNGSFQIFEIALVAENCGSDCSETDIDAYLQECYWEITVHTGNSNYLGFHFYFNENNQLQIIYGTGSVTAAGIWSTATIDGQVVIIISELTDFNELEGVWTIESCEEDSLVLSQQTNSENIEMIIERNCQTCDNPGFLTNDLVIYIPFSNETNDLMNDSAEVIQGTGSYVEDRAGNASCATAFDGNQVVEIPVSAFNQLVQGDSFSISVWFKMQNTNGGDLEILFRKPGNATVGFQLAVYDLNTPVFFDNTNAFSIWDNDWNQEVDVVWDNTDWHHLVVTVDSNNTVKLYRDGILRNTNENSNLTIGSDPTNRFLIGEGFEGHLDDLRVYKRTLSPNDVGDLYQLEADCYGCL